MWRAATSVAGVATTLTLLTLGAAQAVEPDVLRPDPPGTVRVITAEDATTTSRCIGEVATPLCVVETSMACYARDDIRLCARADPEAYRFVFDHPPDHPGAHPIATRYRIVRAAKLGARDAGSLQGPHPAISYPRRRGDVVIVVEWSSDELPRPRQDRYLLRRDDGRWVMVPGQVDAADVIPLRP